VPPLRRRKEDIPELAEAFLARARARGRPVPAGESAKSLSSVALEALAAYDWPGNVRELRNVMERASILSPSGIIEADLIQRLLAAAPSMDRDGATRPGEESLHLRQRVDALERQLLTEALARSGGKKGEAASLLGIDPRNLSYYLKKHGSSEAPAEALGGAEP
jgi:DNA-binding NtrC family response regulator